MATAQMASVTATAYSATVGYEAPPDRTVEVEAEARTLAVPVDGRIYEVAAEDLVHIVGF